MATKTKTAKTAGEKRTEAEAADAKAKVAAEKAEKKAAREAQAAQRKAEVEARKVARETAKAERNAERDARLGPLTGERLAFVVENARPAQTPCLCGCGELTKGRFFPGHDAVLKTRLAATVERGSAEDAALAMSALASFGWETEGDAS